MRLAYAKIPELGDAYHADDGSGIREGEEGTDMRPLSKSKISYLSHIGGGAGCVEDGQCAVSASCWAKGYIATRGRRLPQYRGLTRICCDAERCGTEGCRNDRPFWTGAIYEDLDFPAKVAHLRDRAVIGVFFMGDLALASAEHVRRCFEAALDNPRHQFLVLTKRPAILFDKLEVHSESGVPLVRASHAATEALQARWL